MPIRRKARPKAVRQLDEEQIIRAALQLARSAGAGNLSMRALAAQLGVSPMAIYYHVPNKETLLDLVIDAVLAQVPMPAPDPERWQEQLKACSLSAFHLLAAYPGLSRVMLMRANTKAARALVRYGISILLAAGFDEHQAALAVAAYNTYMYGIYAGLNAAVSRPRAARTGASVNARRQAASPLEGVSAVVSELRALGVDEAIDFGIDAMLTGIAASASGRPRRSAAHVVRRAGARPSRSARSRRA